jgi:hypothetical protein
MQTFPKKGFYSNVSLSHFGAFQSATDFFRGRLPVSPKGPHRDLNLLTQNALRRRGISSIVAIGLQFPYTNERPIRLFHGTVVLFVRLRFVVFEENRR